MDFTDVLIECIISYVQWVGTWNGEKSILFVSLMPSVFRLTETLLVKFYELKLANNIFDGNNVGRVHSFLLLKLLLFVIRGTIKNYLNSFSILLFKHKFLYLTWLDHYISQRSIHVANIKIKDRILYAFLKYVHITQAWDI